MIEVLIAAAKTIGEDALLSKLQECITKYRDHPTSEARTELDTWCTMLIIKFNTVGKTIPQCIEDFSKTSQLISAFKQPN